MRDLEMFAVNGATRNENTWAWWGAGGLLTAANAAFGFPESSGFVLNGNGDAFDAMKTQEVGGLGAPGKEQIFAE